MFVLCCSCEHDGCNPPLSDSNLTVHAVNQLFGIVETSPFSDEARPSNRRSHMGDTFHDVMAT